MPTPKSFREKVAQTQIALQQAIQLLREDQARTLTMTAAAALVGLPPSTLRNYKIKHPEAFEGITLRKRGNQPKEFCRSGQAARIALREKRPISAVAREMGVSQPSVLRWVARHPEWAYEGLDQNPPRQ